METVSKMELNDSSLCEDPAECSQSSKKGISNIKLERRDSAYSENYVERIPEGIPDVDLPKSSLGWIKKENNFDTPQYHDDSKIFIQQYLDGNGGLLNSEDRLSLGDSSHVDKPSSFYLHSLETKLGNRCHFDAYESASGPKNESKYDDGKMSLEHFKGVKEKLCDMEDILKFDSVCHVDQPSYSTIHRVKTEFDTTFDLNASDLSIRDSKNDESNKTFFKEFEDNKEAIWSMDDKLVVRLDEELKQGIFSQYPDESSARDECKLDDHIANVKRESDMYDNEHCKDDTLLNGKTDEYRVIAESSKNCLESQKSQPSHHIVKRNTKLKNHKCSLCEYRTTQKSRLKLHVDGVHLKVRNHKCHFCDYVSTHKNNLKSHIDSVHLKLKSHKCELCEYATPLKRSLKLHMEGVHLKLEHLRCHLCDYIATRRNSLKFHIEGVHLKQKNHKCNLCEYTTTLKSSLKIHINSVHLKLKNHKCHLCEYTSTKKNHLKRHIEGIHLKLKSLKCHLCDFTSLQDNRLTQHINNVHLKLTHKCELCDYTTVKKKLLKRHVDGVHLKLKKHECGMCDYATSEKSSLQRHINIIHSSVKNNKCHICEYSSAEKSYLKRHIEKVHLKEEKNE